MSMRTPPPLYRGGTSSGEPLVLLHGFTDTWRTWRKVIPLVESDFDVLAPTLVSHWGGPPHPEELELDPFALVDGVERAMDAAGMPTAHIAGNSLGGWVTLQL